MSTQCQVAKFVSEKIQMIGKSQKDIAEQAGFDKPNMITMIKQGRTKLPIAKIGPLAIALETDPVHLLKLCLSTYHPETWKAIAPFLVPFPTDTGHQRHYRRGPHRRKGSGTTTPNHQCSKPA